MALLGTASALEDIIMNDKYNQLRKARLNIDNHATKLLTIQSDLAFLIPNHLYLQLSGVYTQLESISEQIAELENISELEEIVQCQK